MTRGRVVAGVLVLVSSLGLAGPARAGDGRPPPVVYDSDMDFDDASTLALLCEEHKLGRIDLRAVTVADDGFGMPGRARRHAHSVLEQCGLPTIPVADGADGDGVHPAPAELVATIETVLTCALDDGGLTSPPSRLTAAQLLARTALSSRRVVTVLATGPMSNVADALAIPGVPQRIDRIQLMGGALAVGGNLYGSALPGFDNSQEFNMWMDPPAARDVLRRARPGSIHLVPLDATRFVPITRDYVARIGAAPGAPGARIAYAIASQPELAALIDLDIMFWWDALAAVALVHPEVVTGQRSARVAIVQEGEQSGRTVENAGGTLVRVATEADRAAFERIFLNALNGRREART